MISSYPKILVVSINAIRKDGSNGKVIRELLYGWPSEKIAQLYFHNEIPDSDICNNYYCVTDRDALLALKTGKKPDGKVSIQKAANLDRKESSNVKPSKNPLTLLLRDFVWNSRRWISENFWQWVEEFAPDIVLVQGGETSFSHYIGIDISEKYQIPLVVLNTENYYLKDYNYLKGKGWGVLFPLLKWESGRAFRKLMNRSSKEMYTNEVLDAQYYKAFGRHGEVIYQGSSLIQIKHDSNIPPIFSYAGNLGISRHKALIEVAEALQKISSDFYLDVYGRAPSEDIVKQLNITRGIRYHGLIPYEKVLEVMAESDFMIHAESFDPFWIKDLNAAFSTKISDILKTGKCLILYADENFACARYVIKNNCGCVISRPDQLVTKLQELISNPGLQKEYQENAVMCANRDMDSKKNAQRFQQIIYDIVTK